MNARSTLMEIQKLIGKAQLLIATLVESQPKPTPGKPPEPRYSQRIKRGIWKAWDKLKAEEEFTAAKASSIVGEEDSYLRRRSVAAYSAILSEWAKAGYIVQIEEGKGRLPSRYKIPN
jgi:hypothetical protein